MIILLDLKKRFAFLVRMVWFDFRAEKFFGIFLLDQNNLMIILLDLKKRFAFLVRMVWLRVLFFCWIGL